MKTFEQLKQDIKTKGIESLETWCNTFKLIGTPQETPRYSQIRVNDNNEVLLYSTIKNGFEIKLFDVEEREADKIELNTAEIWQYWKELRTNHLLNNHPTIDAY